MEIENIRRWHWALIGVLVGLALAYMNSQTERDSGREAISAEEFANELTLHDIPGDLPRLKDIVIYPAGKDLYGKPINIVTLMRAEYNHQDKGWRYISRGVDAKTPFVPNAGRRTNQKIDPTMTIQKYLDGVHARNPKITYQYAWWAEPKWIYSLWTGGSLIILGGIWPTVLNMLIGAGLGPKKKAKEGYDLDRFGNVPEEEISSRAAPKEVTQEEKDRLQQHIETLAKNIGANTEMTSSSVPSASPEPAQVLQLTAGPAATVALDQPEEDKEYKGEFYPVVRTPGAKK